MGTPYVINVIVTIDKHLVYIPEPANLKFKVGDSLNFVSPHGTVTAFFDKPHIFSADNCGEGFGPVQIVGTGSFLAHPTVTLSKMTVGWPEDVKVGASGTSGGDS